MELTPFVDIRSRYCCPKCESHKCTVRYCIDAHVPKLPRPRVHGDEGGLTTRERALRSPTPATFQSAEKLAEEKRLAEERFAVEVPPVEATPAVATIEHLHNVCARCGYEMLTKCSDAKG